MVSSCQIRRLATSNINHAHAVRDCNVRTLGPQVDGPVLTVPAMAIRFDDGARTLACSARDLVTEGAPRGDLRLEVAQSQAARLDLGRRAHLGWQKERGTEDSAFQAEVRLHRQEIVGRWTCTISGRADGLTDEGGRTVVGEVKTMVLGAGRLLGTGPDDWRGHVL